MDQYEFIAEQSRTEAKERMEEEAREAQERENERTHDTARIGYFVVAFVAVALAATVIIGIAVAQ